MTNDRPLSALADATRRRILERLARGPLPVGAIADGLPVTRPAVSQHLKVLKSAGLVRDHAEGTRRVYQIDPAGLARIRIWLDQFWGDNLERYRAAVETPLETDP